MSFNTLEIGRKALIAQRFGIDVTSNNIANVNTPGYSRRQAVFSEAVPNFKYGQFQGQGVLVDKLRNFREDFFDREIRNTISRKAGFEQDDKLFERIETILSEPTDRNLNDAMTDFFNMFEELSLKPETVGLRENLIELGRTVVDKFNYISGTLNDTRKELSNDLNLSVKNANDIIKNIANLNGAFAAGNSLTDNESQSLIDERVRNLEKLAELGEVTSTNNPDGTINVFMNGINIVTKNIPSTIAVQENVSEATGEINLRLVKVLSNGSVVNSISPNTGKLSSLINHFNVTLDGQDTTSGFSPVKRLNEYSKVFVDSINNLMNVGYGLDDKTGEPRGRNFFVINDKINSAFTMQLSADIEGKPRDIPLSAKAGTPGDSTIARAIARLTESTTIIDNQSFTEYYATLIGKLGSVRQESVSNLDNISIVSEQLTNQRESVIGVNMDEEAINLVRYQQAFDAASRIINTTNELLSTIINLGR